MIAFWRRVPGFWQNFIAGLLIIGALLSLDKSAVVKNWEDWAVDTMIRLNGTLARMTGEQKGRSDLRFTLLDMDELSYSDASWNEPFHVPRDKLLKLIEFAVTGKASLIVVDVDLSKAGTDPEADRALKDFLVNYPPKAPPLILMRTKHKKLDQNAASPGRFRDTILGEAARANIHFAQPLFQKDKKDGVVRNWILLDQGCFQQKGLALPSVQLLAYALLKDRLEGGMKNLTDLDASLHANHPRGCETGQPTSSIKRPIILGKTVFKQQKFGERLIYSMPWPKTGYGSPDLSTIPAVFVTDRGFKDYGEVTDRITLIGASYGASHDLHLTPLGLMPGALIILNAVKSLSLFDQISPPPIYIRVGFLLTFITILSFVFSRYSNFIKLLVVSALVFIFFVPISFWLFKYGVWFDFGILLLGIKLQHTLSEFLEVRELKRMHKKYQELEKRVGEAGATKAGAPGNALSSPAEDELDVSVRLKRHADGSYLVKTSTNGQSDTEFDIDSQEIGKSERGYVFALKPRKPTS